MLLLTKIMDWLKVDMETARNVLYEMECTDIRFSEATNAQLKRAAKEAQKWVAA